MSSVGVGAWACASAVNDRQRPSAMESLARMPSWYWAAMRAASVRSTAGGGPPAQHRALAQPEIGADQRQPAQPARGFEDVFASLGRQQVIDLQLPDARG